MRSAAAPDGKIAVGYNSSIKAIRSGTAVKVYLSCDCQEHIKSAVRDAAQQARVEVDETRSMSQLGAMCGIEVGCAVCTVLNI